LEDQHFLPSFLERKEKKKRRSRKKEIEIKKEKR